MIHLDIPDNITVQELIDRYYPAEGPLRDILYIHSISVARKALQLADCYVLKHPDQPAPDRQFIAEAAMLHDIGIQSCDAPGIHCFGSLPYICHGIEGSRILAEDGLLRHALVCERHTGSGLTAEEIEEEALPLPCRDMIPVSIEEKIICYADKFFSKNPESLNKEKELADARRSLAKFGTAPLERFDQLTALF